MELRRLISVPFCSAFSAESDVWITVLKLQKAKAGVRELQTADRSGSVLLCLEAWPLV